MNKNNSVQITKPVPILKKTITLNFVELFKAVGKAGANLFLGKLDDIPGDGIDALSALGLSTGAEEVAWLLVYRSIMQTISKLIDERGGKEGEKFEYDRLESILNSKLTSSEFVVDNHFFSNPEYSVLVGEVKKSFLEWLLISGVDKVDSRLIVDRMPIYFAMSLHEEWGRYSKIYSILRDNVDTPFTQANSRAQGWLRYRTSLRQQVHEPMLLETFCLKQVFIPLRGYYEKKIAQQTSVDSDGLLLNQNKFEYVVVDIKDQIIDWVNKSEKDDSYRLISGGPGSGKSSFAKMLASDISEASICPVLYIPLHHFDVSDDLIDSVGKFIRMDGVLCHNPLSSDQREERLLIIFDGLDELAMQGNVAEIVAHEFIREIQRKVERFNQNGFILKVLITGRELVIQANESMFRKEKQIIHVLPYIVSENDRSSYSDPKNILEVDQRQIWWRLYGVATGVSYEGLPKELDKNNLVEITAQPLLNYLVALSLRRGAVNFEKETNLNVVYGDLLKAIYHRGWAGYQHIAIAGLSEGDFVRILEETALSSWHGDGRTTTVSDITRHCKASGLEKLFSGFQSAVENSPAAGITRLLTAFYFRQNGRDQVGEKTFEFTHKSFGEYLTACRIIREIRLISKKLEQRKNDPDEGWDERESLFRWLSLCGQTPIEKYLFNFLVSELRLRSSPDIDAWQSTLCHLLEYSHRHGMPFERLNPRPDFQEEMRLSRNSEEALMLALNACARASGKNSKISWGNRGAFGSWLSRISRQRPDYGNQPLVLSCLGFLDFQDVSLICADLWKAKFAKSKFNHASFVQADCRYSDFSATVFNKSSFSYGDFREATFIDANLENCYFEEAVMSNCEFKGANLKGAKLVRSNLERASLVGANLENANLKGANLRGADLTGANLRGANLTGVQLGNAQLTGAILIGANLKGLSIDNPAFNNLDISQVVFEDEIDSDDIYDEDVDYDMDVDKLSIDDVCD